MYTNYMYNYTLIAMQNTPQKKEWIVMECVNVALKIIIPTPPNCSSHQHLGRAGVRDSPTECGFYGAFLLTWITSLATHAVPL